MHRFAFSAFPCRGAELDMPSSTPELREIVNAVQIRSFRDFSVEGEAIEAPPPDGDGRDTLSARLATILHRRKYCRPASGASGPKADSRATRVFVAELSEANCGSGNREPGWVVKFGRSETQGRLRRKYSSKCARETV